MKVFRYKQEIEMAEHNRLGKEGEASAVAYLQQKGYTIRHRNWRKNHLELDIVAENEEEVAIVEVKTRSNTHYSRPEDAVTPQKIRRLVIAADAYAKHFQLSKPLRFDIITLIGEAPHFTIEHLERAFYPPLF